MPYGSKLTLKTKTRKRRVPGRGAAASKGGVGLKVGEGGEVQYSWGGEVRSTFLHSQQKWASLVDQSTTLVSPSAVLCLFTLRELRPHSESRRTQVVELIKF